MATSDSGFVGKAWAAVTDVRSPRAGPAGYAATAECVDGVLHVLGVDGAFPGDRRGGQRVVGDAVGEGSYRPLG